MVILFSDGFESNDFTAWTGTAGTPIVQDIIKHHGDYAASFDNIGDYCYETWVETSPIYIRIYFRFTNLPSSTYDQDYFMGLFNSGAGIVAAVGIRQLGAGVYDFMLRSYFPSDTYTVSTVDPETNKWYCIELKFVKDDVNGEYRVWIDGSEQIVRAAVDTSGAGTVNTLRCGPSGITAIEGTQYIDCVVVADSYISPEASTGTKSSSSIASLMQTMVVNRLI